MYFEDYTIHKQLITPSRTISADDIDQFATLTGDHNPLHIDATYAAASSFGRRVAHGLLVQSCASGLASQTIDMRHVLAFRELSTTFSHPVFIDDSIRVELTVVEKKLFRRLNAGNVSLAFRVLNSEDQAVQRGRWALLIKVKA